MFKRSRTKEKKKPYKNEKVEENKKASTKKKVKIQKNITDVLNIVDTNNDYFILKDNSILDFLKIKTKNLNCSEDILNQYKLSITKLLKTSDFDIKIINMTFPTETTEQLDYFNSLKEKTNNLIYKSIIDKKINDLHKVNELITEKEFYIFFYSKDTEEHIKNKNTILSILGTSDLVSDVEFNKKEKVLFKLLNMNSVIFN